VFEQEIHSVTNLLSRRLDPTMGKIKATRSTTRQHAPAVNALAQYEADDGPLGAARLGQIKKLAPQDNKHSLRSRLFDREPARK
jgi:hypothetical protein